MTDGGRRSAGVHAGAFAVYSSAYLRLVAITSVPLQVLALGFVAFIGSEGGGWGAVGVTMILLVICLVALIYAARVRLGVRVEVDPVHQRVEFRNGVGPRRSYRWQELEGFELTRNRLGLVFLSSPSDGGKFPVNCLFSPPGMSRRRSTAPSAIELPAPFASFEGDLVVSHPPTVADAVQLATFVGVPIMMGGALPSGRKVL